MYRYQTYGLLIESTMRLPGFPEAAPRWRRPPDVVIRDEQPSPVHTEGHGRPHDFAAFGPGEAYFFWHLAGGYRTRAGREIVVEPLPDADPGIVRVPLLSTVLAVLLFQRGLLVLRASAVAVGDSAVVLLGARGAGKSTLAVALCARGASLLADEVVAIDVCAPGGPVVIPGPLVPRLWPAAVTPPAGVPDSAAALAGAERFPTDGRAGPLPLGRVYALAEGRAVGLTRLCMQRALIQMVAHSHVARFGTRLLRGAEAATHFRQCVAVLDRTPVYRLSRPFTLASLPQTAELVSGCC